MSAPATRARRDALLARARVAAETQRQRLRAARDAAAARATRAPPSLPARRPLPQQLEEARARERARRTRRRALLLVLLLLLLALLWRCECTEDVLPPPPAAPVGVATGGAARAPAAPKAVGRVARTPRAALMTEERPPPPWLSAFRMQVAARSPALSRCFDGTERPGALKWTTTVHAEAGRTSDHRFEPLLGSAALSTAQQRCIVDVIERGRYQLTGDTSELPRRVTLVLEF